MVPSAAVFAFDDCSTAVVELLKARPHSPDELLVALAPRFGEAEVKDAVTELHRIRAIRDVAVKAPAPKIIPLKPMPIQTLVVNVTNQCNLACEYCYEYGEDKIVDTENGSQPKFMSAETARSAVDLALRESRRRQDGAHHVLRRRDADELQGAEVHRGLRARNGEGAAQGRRLQPHDQRHAAAARRHRLPGRRAHRRHHLDRRPAGDPGQVPRLQQRQGQLRHRGAEDQGAAGAAQDAADRRARHAHQADARRDSASTSTCSRTWASGKWASRRSRPRRSATTRSRPGPATTTCSSSSGRWRPSSSRRRCRTSTTASRTSARRCRKSTWATPRPTRAAPASACWAWRPTARSRCATASPAPNNHRFGSVTEGIDRAKQASFLDEHHIANKTDCATCWARPDLRRRLLSRSAHALRRHDAAEPALLRLDSRVDPHLPRDLRRVGREESRLPATVRRRRR